MGGGSFASLLWLSEVRDVPSDHFLPVDDEGKAQLQLFGGLAAEDHTAEEDLKIVHNGAEVGIDAEIEDDLISLDANLRTLDRIVNAVVDIEGRQGGIANAVVAHVGLVGQDQRRCHGIDGESGGFIVVADGGDDGGDLVGLGLHLVEDTEGHDSTALGVVHAIDDVADIVEIAGDLGKLCLAGGIAEGEENTLGGFGHLGDVGEAVLGIAEGDQRFVGLADIALNGGVALDLFNGNFHENGIPFSLVGSAIMIPYAGELVKGILIDFLWVFCYNGDGD